jgi:hypothetical protein
MPSITPTVHKKTNLDKQRYSIITTLWQRNRQIGTGSMNTLDEKDFANDYEEKEDMKPTPKKVDKRNLATKKTSKGNGPKHKYIPTVWMEGKRMIKRGKAVLQLSNDEIIQTLQNKDKAKRNKEFKKKTDNEVRSGTQSTLANFVSGKVNKPHKNIPVKSIQNVMDNEHNINSNDQDQLSDDEEHFWDSEVIINIMNECKKAVPVDWAATMMLDPEYYNSLEKK